MWYSINQWRVFMSSFELCIVMHCLIIVMHCLIFEISDNGCQYKHVNGVRKKYQKNQLIFITCTLFISVKMVSSIQRIPILCRDMREWAVIWFVAFSDCQSCGVLSLQTTNLNFYCAIIMDTCWYWQLLNSRYNCITLLNLG